MASETAPDTHRPNNSRKLLALLVVAGLLLAGLLLYMNNRTTEAPTDSTFDSSATEQPAPQESGNVDQGENPEEDTVPDPDGSGGNTILRD